MTRTETRAALREIYLVLHGAPPVILSERLAQAGIDLAPMVTCIDGCFYAYPKKTSYGKDVYSDTSPERVIAELRAAGFPKKRVTRFENRREPRAE